MEKKQILIIILLAVVVIGFFVWQGGKTAVLPVQSQLESESALSAEEKFYDFGTISMKDGVVTKTFTVSNPTGKDVRIDSVVTSCMCTTAYLVKAGVRSRGYGMPGHGNTVPKANVVLGAGGDMEVEVVFDPAAHGPAGVGIADRSVYLIDNEGAAFELSIRAQVTL